jgi:hypothetical protein
MDAQFFNGCLRFSLKNNIKFSINKIYEAENIKASPSLIFSHLNALKRIDNLFVVSDSAEIEIQIKVK